MVSAVLKAYASGQFFGETWGSGTPEVMALHGWRRSHADFAAAFAAGAQPAGKTQPAGAQPAGATQPAGAQPAVLALDLPGHGATPPPPERWGSPQYAEALEPVLDEMSDGIVVVGHSLGGRIAVELAAAHPDRVAALVLVGAPLFRPGGAHVRTAPGYRVVRRLAKLGVVSDQRLEAARQRYGSTDYKAAEGVMRDVFVTLVGERYDEALRAITCPISLVWGQLDSDVPLDVAEQIASVVSRSTLTVLEGVGHLVPTEAPEALRTAVSAAIDAR